MCGPGTGRPILVVGVGNTLRRDDGAGPRAADMLRHASPAHVRVVAVHQITPELASDIADASAVVFIDASVAELPGSPIMMVPIGNFQSAMNVGHIGRPEEVLALADAVYGRCPPAYLVAVPATDLSFGEDLSPTTQDAVHEAVAVVLAFANAFPLDTEVSQTQSCTN